MQAVHSLSIHLLGSFEARSRQQAAPVALRRKTCALLAYLAASGQPQSRQALAEIFCPEVDDPPGALRSILSRIRQRLGANILLSEENRVQFNLAAGWVDCLEFARVLDADLASQPPATLAQTIDLYRGEFLANLTLSESPEFELWLLHERARYQRLYERGLEALVTQLLARGEFEPAIQRAKQLIHSNPLREEAHARLMWLYARSGQRAAALAQFEQCRKILVRELGVEPAIELRSLREEIAAGQARPPPLRAVKTAVSATAHLPGDFVGRAAEMAKLQQAWQSARPGHLPVVLVGAAAGMGKTRLIHEFVAANPTASFLSGEGYESTRTLAYAPWLDVLEARLKALDEATLRQLSAFASDYLSRLLPALARRLGRNKAPVAPIAGGELNRLFTAISEFLLELPATPPLLLFVDNLQWADEASLQLFHFLARRSPPGRALLIGAWRTEEAADAPALQALVSDLQRHSLIQLHLTPLPPPAITTLIAQLWPSLPEGYRPHVCEMLARATGGNPLFITEILRELAPQPSAPPALPVPKSIRELIQRRLSQLPESSRQVIEAMAILGAPASLAQAQQTSGRSEEETVTAIDLALRQGFLQLQAGVGDARYDFSHDLMREGVAGQLSHIRRQLLHRRAAQTLERAGAPAATLAYHWRMAGDMEQEGRYAILAGEQAAAIYANEEAVRYLERALQLVDEPERRIHILERLGEVLQLLGRQQEAESLYRKALALANTVTDRRAQARCQVALGRLMRLRGDYAAALAWLEAARATYATLGDQQGLAQTLGGMGAVYWSQLDYPAALTCFQQQLDLASRLGDQQGIGAALGSMGVVYTEQGDYAQALACYTQRLQIDLERNDQLSLAKTIGNMGILYAEQGEYAHALACYHYLLCVMLTLGDRQNVCVAVGNMISVYIAQGQHGVAERLAQMAITLGRMLNIPLYLCEYLYTSAKLFDSLERYSEACAQNNEALDMAVAIGRADIELPALLLSIRLRLALGEIDVTQATQEVESLLDAWPEDHEQAAILYELWRLDNRLDLHRQRAAQLFRRLHDRTPKITYRQSYAELTGAALPTPPPAPGPPTAVVGSPVGLDVLLDQVDHLIARIEESGA
ncbi:MAG: hypothetical protein DCC55_33315 [Chloroflexi bacterium]|nr:MAG: hypothetical protein DCC55_33315 [Chloroflexota bacterium]